MLLLVFGGWLLQERNCLYLCCIMAGFKPIL